MRIGGVYSYKHGEKIIGTDYPLEMRDIEEAVRAIEVAPSAGIYRNKLLTAAFAREFESRKWKRHDERVEYVRQPYTGNNVPAGEVVVLERLLDFVKNRVGLEVNFKTPPLPICSVPAQMTIFHNLGIIDVGIEIVPLKDLADQMSSGVSYFEQFVWDLENRGIADIDIPVLILGVIP